MRYVILILLLAALVSCSRPEVELPEAVPNQFTTSIISQRPNYDSLLVLYNKYVFDDRVSEIEKFRNAVTFPELLPNSIVMDADLVERKPGRVYVVYDTVANRFHNITPLNMRNDLSELMREQYPDGIDSLTAFRAAVITIRLRQSARALVSRKADVYLAGRLDSFIGANYKAKPGSYNREFDRVWWGWTAFPSCDNNYRLLHSHYVDSMKVSPMIASIPDEAAVPPRISYDGKNYGITLYYLPAGPFSAIERFDFFIRVDGTIERYDSGEVFVFDQESSL